MKIKMYTKKEIDAMLKKYDSVGVVMKYDEDFDDYLIRNPKPDKEKRRLVVSSFSIIPTPFETRV